MNISPQYIYDSQEQPIGVFLTIDVWNAIAEKLEIAVPGSISKTPAETWSIVADEMLDDDDNL